VTGQTVVLIGIVLVTTAVGVPGRSGQSVTDGAQEVIVTSLVLYIVDVVYARAVLLFFASGLAEMLDVAWPVGAVDVRVDHVMYVVS